MRNAAEKTLTGPPKAIMVWVPVRWGSIQCLRLTLSLSNLPNLRALHTFSVTPILDIDSGAFYSRKIFSEHGEMPQKWFNKKLCLGGDGRQGWRLDYANDCSEKRCSTEEDLQMIGVPDAVGGADSTATKRK